MRTASGSARRSGRFGRRGNTPRFGPAGAQAHLLAVAGSTARQPSFLSGKPSLGYPPRPLTARQGGAPPDPVRLAELAGWALLVRRVTATPFWFALVAALALTPAFGSGGDALIMVDLVLWALILPLTVARILAAQPFYRLRGSLRHSWQAWALPTVLLLGGGLLAAGFQLLGPTLAHTTPLAVTVTGCVREYQGDPSDSAPVSMTCGGHWQVDGKQYTGELPVTGRTGQTVALRVRPSDPANPLASNATSRSAGTGMVLGGIAIALVGVIALTLRSLSTRAMLRSAKAAGQVRARRG